VLDFAGPEYVKPDTVAEILVAKVQVLSSIGQWQQIIWHSTSFPEVNPGKKGELVEIARGEWTAFNHAMKIDPTISNIVMFGDYAADSAKFLFGKGRAAIPHLRYSTFDKWLVSRGKEVGNHAKQMPDVALKILESTYFYGKTFSKGDRYVFELSKGISVGGPKEWRRANICHHLTAALVAIGSRLGYSIQKVAPVPEFVQFNLFDSVTTK
jgi:Beta protein